MRIASNSMWLGALLALLVVQSLQVSAQTRVGRTVRVEPPKGVTATSERPEFFGSATLFSDNRSQGFTSNNEDPVLQIDGGIIWRNFYIGASGSNVDLGRQVLANGGSRSVGRYAVTYYAGYVNSWRGFDWDVSVSYATHPGARDANAELDYWEMSFGISKVFIRDIRNGLRFYWAPDYTANQGHNFVLESSLEKPLPSIAGITPLLETVVGRQFGDEGRGNFDYWFWEVGVELPMSEHFSIDLRYHDTADVPFDSSDQCGARFVASATVEF